MPIGMKTEDLMLPSDPTYTYTLLEQVLFPGAFRVEVVVNNPPNHLTVSFCMCRDIVIYPYRRLVEPKLKKS